uniref:Uncharacterized protein n=1 Tax=Sphaerodactylus townsendi TaxID=933632 RepID=A0ACB8EIJ1_9SAUR
MFPRTLLITVDRTTLKLYQKSNKLFQLLKYQMYPQLGVQVGMGERDFVSKESCKNIATGAQIFIAHRVGHGFIKSHTTCTELLDEILLMQSWQRRRSSSLTSPPTRIATHSECSTSITLVFFQSVLYYQTLQ